MEITVENNKVSYNPFEAGYFVKAVPTTEAQREIWGSIVMDTQASLCYNEALAIDFYGHLDTNLLNLAFQELLKRHDALRTVFSADGKIFFVKEYEYAPILFLDYSLQAVDELEQLKKREVQTKYDLVKGPCYRATLVKTGYDLFTFIFSAHHIVCDGWSFAVLLSELSEFYEVLSQGKKITSGLADQFSDFAIDEHKNGVEERHRSYWLKEFERALDGNVFPTDFKRPTFRTFNSARYDLALPPETIKRIKKMGAGHGCSLYNTLASVFIVLLYRLTRSNDVVVAMASASQSGLGKNDLVGHLVNLLPLRASVQENLPFNIFMKSVRSKMLDAFDHQFYSYGSLVKDLKNIKRDPATLPLCNIVFNIDQQAPDQGLSFKGINSNYQTIARDYENFEIFINAVSSGDKLTLECQYNTNLFSPETISNWMNSFIEMLNMVSVDPLVEIKKIEIPNLKIPSVEEANSESLTIKEKEMTCNLDMAEKVKKFWVDILLDDSIALNDNFFAIGGHSLLAVELAGLLEKEFKVPVSIKDIFENPTIVSLSNKLSNLLMKEVSLLPGIVNTGAKMANVSNNQQQIWFIEEMHPQISTYVLPSTLRVKTKINREVLEKTIHLLMQRHPALRTIIQVENGVPVQKILDIDLPQFKPILELIKTSEDKVIDLINAAIQVPFNKEEAPLFRVKLIELNENDYVIFSLIHHSIWDGWSFDIYFEELNLIYSALLRGVEPPLAKAPSITYLDYSLWLENLIQNKYLDKEITFWKEKLKGPLPILELPADFKRPKVMSHSGAGYRFSFSPQLMTQLSDYAKRNQSSQFNVILTAFKITLARYCNLDDIIVGLPVRGRNTPEVMQTIGYFVNTLALRSFIDLKLSFEENLKRVSETCIEALDNQLIPFQIILSKINYQRDPGCTPIFQTFFSYQDVNHRSRKIDGVTYSHLPIDKASTHTDLDLWIRASANKIDGGFEYNKEIFKSVTIERFTECFLSLLEGLTQNADRPIQDLRALTTKQENLILKEWNDTIKDSTPLKPFYQTFEEHAKRHPHALAVESSHEQLSYLELKRQSDRCANALLARGVGRGDLVGISLTRNSKLLAAILGVLKTGAGYVPLDPGFPQERLDYMINSSSPKVLLTEESLMSRFKTNQEKIIIDQMINNTSFDYEVPSVAVSGNDTVYVIYTSGSTGKPKGVQVKHESVSNFLSSMENKIEFSHVDKILAVTTLSFDIAVLELFLPLFCGGTVYLANSTDVLDGAALKNILDQKEISVMQATPSTWRLLLAAGWQGNKKLKVLCGGEAFPIDLAQKLIPICQSVFNMYGPTETTVWSACKELSLNDSFITVGRPIANTSLYVLDNKHLMKPIGATGELFIGGAGVAKGYYGRPDLTSERFIADPFNPGKIMYATGDLARFTAEGEIECLGRNDGQVKVRGYRIELGEIEAEMQKIPGVHEVAVITHEYRPGDVRIFAYFSTLEKVVLNERVLREALSKKLPLYMIPSHFTYMPDIPKTLNGKVDKKSLPRIESSSSEGPVVSEIIEEKETNDKKILRSMWMEILGIRELKNSDNFFNLGGNSLLAVSLFSKIANVYKINVPLAVLIEAENFDEFSKNIEARLSNKLTVDNNPVIPSIYKSLVAIKSSGNKSPLFCFHGVGGNILNYVSLLPATKNERPLLAIQSVGLDGITPPLLSIEEMAKSYIKEIRIAQPQGPYLLAGGSMGGMIAFEAAIQLCAAGEKVEKLIMFDTFGPNLDLKACNLNRQRSLMEKIKDALMIRTKFMANKIQSNFFRKLGLPIPMPILLGEIERKNYHAIWNYFPQNGFDGDLHLVRSKMENQGWYSDPTMGWRGMIKGEIKTYEIKGTHHDFMESPELLPVLENLI